jgi:glycosyltransferase involved in cell wall biosynthesis
MKIAVWINYSFSPIIGGTFSYVDRLLKTIDDYDFDEALDVCFVTSCFVQVADLKKELIRLQTPFEVILSKIPIFSKIKFFQLVARRLMFSSYRKQLVENNVKLIFYPSQFVRCIPKFPFIVSHWDIAHRSTYAFPEFSFYLHKKRDKYYADFLPKALMIFVESEAGKRELVRYSALNDERIRVVPIFPGECTTISLSQEEQDTVLRKFGLMRRKYFYYPAQFLAEKNHIVILKALSRIAKKYPDYKIMFTGSSSKKLYGTIDYIKSESQRLKIEDRIIFGGFVSQEEVYSLYNNACAHIMASYVGPTNMPPLEAMTIGCPVICTNISGHYEEMGDAALYFDAKRDDQLAEAMEEMITNRDVYKQKIKEHSANCIFTIQNAIKHINNNFLEAKVIRETWG